MRVLSSPFDPSSPISFISIDADSSTSIEPSMSANELYIVASRIQRLHTPRNKLETSKLKAPAPSMSRARPSHPRAERAGNPVIPERRIIIPNKHGENLVGILHETGSKELVMLCHGFQSSKERIPMINLAIALEREGISAFRFDFAGNGESEGSFQYGNYWREADDLRAVIEHFLGQKRLIKAIIGHSKGGNVVLLYASKYDDVNTVVNISGRFNLERGIEGRLGKDFLQRIKKNGFIDVKNKRGEFEYRVTEESLMERLTTDTRTSSQMISRDCRVLTVHGSLDKIVPAEDSLEFAKVISNHKLCIMEGADHEYTSHQDELTSVVLDFVKTDSCPNKGTVNPFPPSKPAKSPHSRM